MWRAVLVPLLACAGCNQIFGLDKTQVEVIDSPPVVGCSADLPCTGGLVCDPVSSQCVTCLPDTQPSTCPAATPICGSDEMCHGCVVDTDCASQICDPDTGTCADATKIVYVDGDQGSDGAPCTLAQPCKSINHALTALAGNSTIHVTGVVTVPTLIVGVTVSIVGTGSSAILHGGTGSIPALAVGSGADVTIRNVVMTSSQQSGLQIRQNATVTATDCDFSDNAGTGIEIQGSVTSATTRIYGSRIRRNAGGGVTLTAGHYDFVGNEIYDNGATNAPAGGVSLGGPADGRAALNTIVDNTGGTGGLECAGSADVDSNLIAFNHGLPVSGSGSPERDVDTLPESNCGYSYNLFFGGHVDYGSAFMGGSDLGNNTLTADPELTDLAGGDLTIGSGSPAQHTGDPSISLVGPVARTPAGALRTPPPNRGAY